MALQVFGALLTFVGALGWHIRTWGQLTASGNGTKPKECEADED